MREESTLRTDDRGVSEVMGYVFVFSLVVGSIGLLYVSGVGSLESLRTGEQANNAERAFVALAESFGAVLRGQAPARAGEIRVGGGTVSVRDGPSMTVTLPDGATTTYGMGALTYHIGESTVWYEGAAVFREAGGSVMVRDPSFRCTPGERAVVTVVRVVPADTTSVSTQNSVLVVGERLRSTLVYPGPGVDQTSSKTVSVSVSSQNADAWGEYFAAQGWTDTGGTYECTAPRVVVREVVVRIQLLD